MGAPPSGLPIPLPESGIKSRLLLQLAEDSYPYRVARSKQTVEGRSLARIKEAHEVEQVRPGFVGLGSISGYGGHDSVRCWHDWFHVGFGHAVQPDCRFQD